MTHIFTKNNRKNPVFEVMTSMFLANPTLCLCHYFFPVRNMVLGPKPTLPIFPMSLILLFFFLKASLSKILSKWTLFVRKMQKKIGFYKFIVMLRMDAHAHNKHTIEI